MNADIIYKRLHDAVFNQQFEEEIHESPSPSGVHGCVRRQVWARRKIPPTNPRPVRALKKLASGKLAETFWVESLEKAGFKILPNPERIPIRGPEGKALMTGEIDCLLEDKDTGARFLAEFKDLGMWGYLGVVKDGLKKAEPAYYTQVQLYIHGARQAGLTSEDWALFLVGQADSSAVSWLSRRYLKAESEPPDFHLEVVELDPEAVSAGLRRAQIVLDTADGPVPDEQVPREFDPVGLAGNPRSSAFPCGRPENPYCPYLTKCIETGGLPFKVEANLWN